VVAGWRSTRVVDTQTSAERRAEGNRNGPEPSTVGPIRPEIDSGRLTSLPKRTKGSGEGS
jgi:hypothetical protein